MNKISTFFFVGGVYSQGVYLEFGIEFNVNKISAFFFVGGVYSRGMYLEFDLSLVLSHEV